MTTHPIAYSTTQTSLGCLLVAGTTDGIYSVKLSDSKAELVQELEQELGAIQPTETAPVVDWMRNWWLTSMVANGPTYRLLWMALSFNNKYGNACGRFLWAAR